MHEQPTDQITDLVLAGNDRQLVTLIFQVLDADAGSKQRVGLQIAVARRYITLAQTRKESWLLKNLHALFKKPDSLVQNWYQEAILWAIAAEQQATALGLSVLVTQARHLRDLASATGIPC